MKNIFNLLAIIAFFNGNAQCLSPSNLTLSNFTSTTVEFSWIENGTAINWEVSIIPDFNVGDSLPTSGTITASNPHTFINLPQLFGCNVFFVRSLCSSNAYSPWVAIGTGGCSTEINNYLATLSNNTFLFNDSKVIVFPNPSNSFIQIKSTSTIDKLTVFDSLGKVVSLQTQNNNEINIENLSNGIYFIEILSDNERFYKKFIKE